MTTTTNTTARQAGLTDERIKAIWRSVPNHHIDFARAIERAALAAHSADARKETPDVQAIDEAFDSFCRSMSLVQVLYREDAHKFVRCLFARASDRSIDGSISAADAVNGVMDLFPSADRQALVALSQLLWKPREKSADARNGEHSDALARELLDALRAFKDAGQGFHGWHAKYEGAIEKANAAIAKAEEVLR